MNDMSEAADSETVGIDRFVHVREEGILLPLCGSYLGHEGFELFSDFLHQCSIVAGIVGSETQELRKYKS